MLVTDVPHAEQRCGNGGDHHEDKDALEIDGVTYVGTLPGDGPGHVEEGLKSINGGMQPVEFAAFFENRVHTFKPFP